MCVCMGGEEGVLVEVPPRVLDWYHFPEEEGISFRRFRLLSEAAVFFFLKKKNPVEIPKDINFDTRPI